MCIRDSSIIEPSFVSYSRIISALNYAYFLGFLALGVTFVIATGEIDFSIGPVMFCAALIGGKLFVDGVPMGACLIITIPVSYTHLQPRCRKQLMRQ